MQRKVGHILDHIEPVTTGNELTILELPSVLTHLFAQAGQPLPIGPRETAGLFVRYLRRKAGRGLAVIYAVDDVSSSHKTRVSDPRRSVSLTLEEEAMNGPQIGFNATQAYNASLHRLPSGVLQAPDLGLSVQAFPADAHLPALAQSCDTTPGSLVFEAVQSAARAQLGDNRWQIIAASAEPVRYKPGSRCVIRYHVQLKHASTSEQKALLIFGKVYADPGQAGNVQFLQQQLYDDQKSSDKIPLLPRPLGLIEHIGLTFNEAVQPAHNTEMADDIWNTLRTGTRAIQPHIEQGKEGAVISNTLPEEELRLTAQALARLHTSKVFPPENTLRPGKKEAKRARERAALIAGRNPEQAAEVQQLSQTLASHLEQLQPEEYRPAHGGFKSSQLLFHSHRVFVVDFDGFCRADAALDVGYFLAYLRPSGLWYQRAGMREWFDGAATLFRTVYQQEMLGYGVAPATIEGILQRSRLYEAALIFKIATRRVNRLNSPRPQELAAMLHEIGQCLP
jgi:thiamine kinase-like enzyme